MFGRHTSLAHGPALDTMLAIVGLLLAPACTRSHEASTAPAVDPQAPAQVQPADAPDDPSTTLDTPAGDRVASIIEFLASWDGDETKAAAFVDATLAPEFRDRFPMEQHVEFLRSISSDFPRLELRQVISSEQTRVRAYLQSADNQRWLELDLQVSAESPHHVQGILARPTAQPLAPELLAVLDGDLDREAKAAAVGVIADLLEARYVHVDVAKKAGQALTSAMDAGEYDDIEDRAAFAERLTEDLRAVAKDKHLRVWSNEGRAAKAAEPSPEPEPEPIGPHGFAKSDLLPGGIGYIDLRFFAPPEVAKERADAAMQSVEGAGALIFDMRRNGGGDPRGVQYLSSFLFAQRTHLNSLYWRQGDRTEEYWTLDEVGAERQPDVPVFVLTSNYTFSGAEEFTYNLKMLERATIIGEVTGGGANPGGVLSIGSHLEIFVPTGMAINPISGTNWEGVGVEPDVAVPADDALDEALERAKKAAAKYRNRRRKGR